MAYCEARFCPHLLLAPVMSNGVQEGAPEAITSDEVVEAVLKGIAEGEEKSPGTRVRLILSCIRGMPGGLGYSQTHQLRRL